MKKEYLLFTIVGFFLLSYLLDAVVNPLSLNLITPYHFFTPQYLSQYAFTTTSILLKAIAILFTPILVLDFLGIKATAKGIAMIVLSALLQLYALQDIATQNQVVPLEWSLAFTLGGILLIIPAILYIIAGSLQNMNQKLADEAHLLTQTEKPKLKKLSKD